MDGLNALKNPELKKFFGDNLKSGTPVDAVAASKTIGTSTSVVTLTSDNKGAVGNDFTIAIVSSSATTASLAISFNPITNAIVVTPARATGSDTTTGAELEAAINASSDLDGLITASSGGNGIMAEVAATNLENGVDGTPGIAGFSRYVDANYNYFCTTDADVNSSGAWKKVPHFNDTFVVGTPVDAVAAVGTLTVGGVVIDGDTVTIDGDTYEFAADDAQTVTSGNTAVDITASTTASTINLTVDTQVTADDTMVIGTKTYTFVADGTESADGDISVGTDLATGQANIVAAINGTDSINTANAVASAGDFNVSHVSAITALIGGVAGDSIATTSSFTTGSNLFAGTSLASGADCTAANGITALVAAEVTTASYTMADVDTASMSVTYDTKGIVGNSIEVSETFTTASNVFDATTLGATTAGVNGTVGIGGISRYADSTNIYFCIADATITDTGKWKKIAHSAL